MAEGWLKHLGKEEIEVFSAGTHPETVNPLAIAVMKEVGIDIGYNQPNHLDEFIDMGFDYVITVCDNAQGECPVFPGLTQHVHRSFEDPARAVGTEEQIFKKYQKVRDEIGNYANDFLTENM